MRLFLIFVLLTCGTVLLSSYLRRQLPDSENLRPRLLVFEFPDIRPLSPAEISLAKLGHQLFHDKSLSADGQLACSTCHNPKHSYADSRSLSSGISPGDRNAPATLNLFDAGWLFWDGRSDSLEMLAMEHLESAGIHGISRWHVAHRLFFHYSEQYQKIFGTFPSEFEQLLELSSLAKSDSNVGALPAANDLIVPPSLEDVWQQFHFSQLPPQQRWVDQYQAFSEAQSSALDKVFWHGIQALAQYQKALITRDAAVDRYLKRVRSQGVRRALDDEFTNKHLRGFLLFTGKAGCNSCHNGPLFSDGDFHNTGLAQGSRQTLGRTEGLVRWAQHEFACQSENISEKITAACQPGERQRLLADQSLLRQSLGQIKTPSLRNVAQTAPYMNDGSFARLEDVLQAYNQAFTKGVGKPDPRIKPLGLSAGELSDLLAFLHALSSEVEDLSGN